MEQKVLRKKAQSNILSLLLIIMIILVMLVILWNLSLGLIKKNIEIGEIKYGLMNFQLSIEKVKSDNLEIPVKINISLKRGPEGNIIVNRTVINFTEKNPIYADIVTAIDLSGSMFSTGYCRINETKSLYSCCIGKNCSIKEDCESCLGQMSGNFCFISSYNTPCCKTLNCSKSANCTSCGGTFLLGNRCNINGSIVYNSKCNTNANCISSLCNGTYIPKINLAKISNLDFIDSVFNKSYLNKIGIVGYETSVNIARDCHLLSNDTISLKSKINGLGTYGSTCICCGINQSINYLKIYNNNTKTMIVMSDGQPNINCSTNSALDSINFSKVAHEKYNITVYSIGFGDDVNETLMRKIAEVGNGSYYYVDTSGLNDVYKNIADEIDFKIEETIKNMYTGEHLRVVIYNESNFWIEDIIDMPLPLETKEYILPSTGSMYSHVSNVTKIEVYIIAYTKSGKEISQLLSTWNR